MTKARRFETIHMDDSSVAYYDADPTAALKHCAEMNQAAAESGDARTPYSVWDSIEGRIVEASAKVVETPAVPLRIYAACLASYNNGILHGAWIEVDGKDHDELYAEVKAMLATSPVAGAEEFAIHDHEGFGRLIGEWTDLNTLAIVAKALSGPHALGFHWLIEARGYDIPEAAKRAEEVCIHQNDDRRWDLAVDWTEDMIAETMDLDKLPELIRNNIDYKGAAHELTINGRLDDHSVADERFLVTNADEF